MQKVKLQSIFFDFFLWIEYTKKSNDDQKVYPDSFDFLLNNTCQITLILKKIVCMNWTNINNFILIESTRIII